MPAGYTELFLEQGADFNMSITLDDVAGSTFNLVNYSATSQMRKSYYSSNATATFSVSTGADPSLGTITISLDSANTSNITSVFLTMLHIFLRLLCRTPCQTSSIVLFLNRYQ